jgi:malate dehydrogenase (oxaloacetate-decarboxylating)(NADP+)
MISGLTTHYPDTVRPALEIIGKDPKYNKVSGLYIVSTKKNTYFLSDTTINLEPDAETLADIALQAADFVTNFDLEPQVAMLSYSNFGSAEGKSPEKIRKALQIIREKAPKLIIDGEMQADTAVEKSILTKDFPFSVLKDEANTLIFPDLNSGNIAYKLLARIGGANVIGPVLQGLEKSVHILQRGSDVNQILDMVAIAVVDANHKGDKCVDIFK